MKKQLIVICIFAFFLLFISVIFVPRDSYAQSGCTKVVAKDGSGDYTTIQAGIDAISTGQTLCVKGGNWKYEEAIKINKANITVKNYNSTLPVLDGRYHRGLITGGKVPFAPSGNFLPGYTSKFPDLCPTVRTYNAKAMVSISQPGATFDGFIIQNIAGHGVAVSASNVTVKNNKLYWIHDTAIMSNVGGSAKIHGIKVLDNTVLFASVFSIDTAFVKSVADCREAQGKDPHDPAGGLIKFGSLDGGMLIKGNYLAYGYGEGINIGKDNNATAADPIIVENNVIHDSRHKIINTNNANFVHVRNNLAFSPDPMVELGNRTAGGPFEILDEVGGNSHDVYFYNNIVVNTETNCFRFGGRDSNYSNIYIGFNTFVAGPNTSQSCIDPSQEEKTKGIFENNIIYIRPDSTATSLTNGSVAGGLTYRNNIWYPQAKAPSGGIFGSNSLTLDPKLVDPNSKIQPIKFPGEQSGTYLNFTDLEFLPNGFQMDISANKYRINTGSPAINAASQRTAVAGFMPPIEAYATDFFGRSRGNNPDIGAHESDGTQPPLPSPSPSSRSSPTSSPQPSASPTTWDLNTDGKVNAYDFVKLVKGIGSSYTLSQIKIILLAPFLR